MSENRKAELERIKEELPLFKLVLAYAYKSVLLLQLDRSFFRIFYLWSLRLGRMESLKNSVWARRLFHREHTKAIRIEISRMVDNAGVAKIFAAAGKIHNSKTVGQLT